MRGLAIFLMAVHVCSTTLFPQVIHRVWISDSPIPLNWQEAHAEWVTQHPGWQVHMWNQSTCRGLLEAHYDWFLDQWDHYSFPIQLADVCRYFVLHRHGGIYADLDIRPLRSMAPILEKAGSEEKQVVMLQKDTELFSDDVLCIGMIASVASSPFWESVFTVLQERRHRWYYAFSPHLRVIMSSGPQAVMPVVRAQRHSVGVFPAAQFYACDVCAPLPCQRDDAWVRWESGGFSWNRWDSIILSFLLCNVGKPYLRIVNTYPTLAALVTYSLVAAAICALMYHIPLLRICTICYWKKTWQRQTAKVRQVAQRITYAVYASPLQKFRAWLLMVTLLVLLMAMNWMAEMQNGYCGTELCHGGSVLLVIAHPDDESMFFLPTIQSCIQANIEVHILCLSNGNAAGLGGVRERELHAVGELLGVANITVVNDTGLQDGPENVWDLRAIQMHVSRYVRAHDISNILTFDLNGVSQHPNHLDVNHAMRQLHRRLRKANVQFYQLESVGLLRKFLGALDVPISQLQRPYYQVFWGSLPLSWSAMARHKSQFVLFRKLFVLFSRYTYVNTLRNFEDLLFAEGQSCRRRTSSKLHFPSKGAHAVYPGPQTINVSLLSGILMEVDSV